MSDTDQLAKDCKAMECPYCKEVALTPVRREVGLYGVKFTTWECQSCTTELVI